MYLRYSTHRTQRWEVVALIFVATFVIMMFVMAYFNA